MNFYFKNHILEAMICKHEWFSVQIEVPPFQVMMEMQEGGSSVAHAIFDGTSSDKMTWLNASRLLSSSWRDVKEYTATNDHTASVDGVWV